MTSLALNYRQEVFKTKDADTLRKMVLVLCDRLCEADWKIEQLRKDVACVSHSPATGKEEG